MYWTTDKLVSLCCIRSIQVLVLCKHRKQMFLVEGLRHVLFPLHRGDSLTHWSTHVPGEGEMLCNLIIAGLSVMGNRGITASWWWHLLSPYLYTSDYSILFGVITLQTRLVYLSAISGFGSILVPRDGGLFARISFTSEFPSKWLLPILNTHTAPTPT